MFDQLFRSPAVLRRHRDGPLAQERVAFLTRLAIQGSPTGTLLKCARYGLAIAHALHWLTFTTPHPDGAGFESYHRALRSSSQLRKSHVQSAP